MYKIKTHHTSKEGRVFSWMVLMVTFGFSLIFPIFPNFIREMVNTDENTSLFYSAMALMMLIGALSSTIIFKKVKRTTIIKWAFLLSAATFFLMPFANRILDVGVLRTAQVWARLFVMIAISLYVRDFADRKNLGEEEGVFYKFSNIGIFFGPLIGGFAGAYLSEEVAFIFSSAVMLFGVSYFYYKQVIEKVPAITNMDEKKQHAILGSVKDFFRNSGRTKSYIVTMFNLMWVVFKYLYIPLYALKQGYPESIIGLVLSIGIIPYILLEVGVGEYADKKGVRLPVSTGFAIIAFLLALVFISPWPILNLIILILCSIGASLVEPVQEYILFKNLTKEEEDRLYGVYMTVDPVAYFLTPMIGAGILFFLPFNYLFLAFSIIMLLASGISWKMLKVKA